MNSIINQVFVCVPSQSTYDSIMDKSWYQKLFCRQEDVDEPLTKTDSKQNDTDTQFGLGVKYANSHGEAQDYVEAAQWYRKAADQGHSLAQLNLGVMYANGQGVPQDEKEAVLWIRKAANLGDAGAQFKMGIRYYRASVGGVPVDALESKVEAYKWLYLAAAQGYQGAVSACERMTLTMNREEVNEGNLRATAFVAHERATPSI
jgi:hypothetical protein